MNARKYFKKSLKVFKYTLLSLLTLLVLLIVALQFSYVQTRIARIGADYLTETIGTEVSIDKVKIRFFNSVAITGLYIEDERGDTLLRAGNINAQISLLNLIGNELQLSNALLEDGTLNVYRGEDSVFNFQFIMDAFATEDTTESTPFTFDIGEVQLKNIRANYTDLVSFMDIELALGELKLVGDELDLEAQKVALNLLELRGTRFKYTGLKQDSPSTELTDTSQVAAPLAFPDLGWGIYLDQIQLADNVVIYSDENSPAAANGVDFNHLGLSGIEIDINSFSWEPEAIEASVNQIAFAESSGLELQKFKVDISVNPSSIAIENLEVKTPDSHIRNDTRLNMQNFEALEDFLNAVRVETSFEESYIAATDVELLLPGTLKIEGLKDLSRQKVQIYGAVEGKVSDLKARSLVIELAEQSQLALSGHVKGLPNINDLWVDIDLEQLSSHYDDLTGLLSDSFAIPEGAKQLGLVSLSGRFKGHINHLKVDGLALNTEAYTGFSGDVIVEGLPAIDSSRFSLKINRLATSYDDMKAVFSETIPEMIASVDTIVYSGVFSGRMDSFHLAGRFETGIGTITNDFTAAFTDSFTKANYQGQLSVNELRLDKLLADTSLGPVSMELEANGSGMALEDVDVTLNALISKLRFQGYNYKDIYIDGSLANQLFVGQLGVDDHNLKFNFDGSVSLDTLNPVFAFKANLDTANLKALNLYPETLNISTAIEADFSSLSSDELDGSASVNRLHLTNDSLHYYLEALNVFAGEAPNDEKKITIHSDVVNGLFLGKFDLAALPGSIGQYVHKHYAFDQTAESNPIQSDQQFKLELDIIKPTAITRLFAPKLQKLDSISIRSTFDSRKEHLSFDLNVPDLIYDSISLEHITASIDGSSSGIDITTEVTNTRLNPDLTIAQSMARIGLKDNKMQGELAIKDNDTTVRLGVNAVLSSLGEQQKLTFIGPIYLNNNEWNIPSANAVVFGPKDLNVQQIKLARNGKKLALQSDDSKKAYAPINVQFTDFNLSEFTDLVSVSGFDLEGSIDGTLTLSSINEHPYFTSDLTIQNITLNDNRVGDLALTGIGDEKEVLLSTKLTGPNTMAFSGKYIPQNQRLDLTLDIEKLNLGLLDPFVLQSIENTTGHLVGKVDINGDAENPAIEGYMQLLDVETDVKYLNGRYKLSSDKIRINDELIDIGTFELIDPAGRVANFEGTIRHKQFADLRLNLNFDTDEFLFMNTDADDNELFHGKILMKVKANVTGTPELPKANVTAKTLKSTHITILPITAEEDIKQESFIIFMEKPVAGDSLKMDSIKFAQKEYKAKVLGVDLNLNLELTDETQLTVVIDPVAGDQLDIRGNANLNVDIPSTGDMKVTGSFIVSEGHYALKNPIKKEFIIEKGGTVDFVGDIMDSRLNLSAIYQARTTTYGLVANQATRMTDIEKKAAKQKQQVNVYLKVNSKLSEPELSFDIQLPDISSSAISSTIERKLEDIRLDESELNKQVFGLLLFDSFITSNQNSDTDFGNSGRDIALSSVSNLITGQLNKLAKNAEAVNIDFLLDSYDDKFAEPGAEKNITQVGLKVSTKLPNDRIVLSVGSDVQMESESPTEEVDGTTDLSTISGEFTLEYKLTEDGRYRLKVFQNTDFDLLTESNDTKTGVGVSFQRSFGDPTNEQSDKRRKKREAKLPHPPKEQPE